MTFEARDGRIMNNNDGRVCGYEGNDCICNNEDPEQILQESKRICN